MADADPGVSTADLRAMTAGTAYDLHLSCLSAYPGGSIDAAWRPATGSRARPRFPEPTPTAGPHTNDPLWARATEALVRELRAHLRDAFGPAFPVNVVCVETLPRPLPALADPLGTPA